MDIEADLTRYAALAAKRAGWEIVFVRWGEKAAIDDEWQIRRPTLNEIDYRMKRRRLNYGLILNTEAYRTLVVDRDADDPAAIEWMATRGATSEMEVNSPHGLHVYRALDGRIKEARSRIRHLGLPLDLKASGYVIGPGSWNEECSARYTLAAGKRLLAPHQLEVLPLDELLIEPQPERRTCQSAADNVVKGTCGIARSVSRAERYVLRIESIQGEGGSRGLVRAVSRLRDAGWAPRDIYDFLCAEWNHPPRVTPPWPPEDIARAVRRHAGDF